jgi:hypothetical protein
MKYLFGLTLVASVALLTLGQAPRVSAAMSRCTLTRDQFPEIRGIRLGMSTDQLLRLFPEEANRARIDQAITASKQAGAYGVGRFDLWPEKAAPNPRLEGVNYITIELIDQRVTSFNVTYIGPEWKTVDQFVTRLSEGLRLPLAFWEPGGETSQHMRCEGFKVDAYTSRGSTESTVRVQDTSAPQLVEDRREAAKEKARQAFKP